ncbi:alpha/beta hydrolase [Microbulbifer sp. OS29]|uniref:Alpha/beta hydrolase n=1 Tax=Microbulbifer okhotskensis TaxID=2926617 RepID=A0A9X2EVA1_9GAMM|nr:alpha/beta hydrolase [Microbulbifer okhotskensis]MCO1336606.1 alpha/beta hydrolase [Microbulbifer okhotskensis]
MQPHQWLTNGQWFNCQSYQLFYADSAPNNQEKPVLLLIHGFPTSSFDWQKVWPHLTKYFRCIAMDMLGFGYSDKPKEHHYSIHGQADLNERLLHLLGINSAHILAHDYGDTVAQELLTRANAEGNTRYPSVSLLNGGLFPETHQPRLIQKLLLSSIGPLVNRLIGYPQFCRSFRAIFGPRTQPSAADLQDLWQILQYNKGGYHLYKLITYMRDRRQHRQRWVDALNNYPGPLQLINGSLDPVSGRHMVERFRQLINRPANIAEFSEIGHYPQWEAPDLLVSNYLEFIETYSNKAAQISV